MKEETPELGGNKDLGDESVTLEKVKSRLAPRNKAT